MVNGGGGGGYDELTGADSKGFSFNTFLLSVIGCEGEGGGKGYGNFYGGFGFSSSNSNVLLIKLTHSYIRLKLAI